MLAVGMEPKLNVLMFSLTFPGPTHCLVSGITTLSTPPFIPPYPAFSPLFIYFKHRSLTRLNSSNWVKSGWSVPLPLLFQASFFFCLQIDRVSKLGVQLSLEVGHVLFDFCAFRFNVFYVLVDLGLGIFKPLLCTKTRYEVLDIFQEFYLCHTLASSNPKWAKTSPTT